MPVTNEFFNSLDYIYFGIIFLFSLWGYFSGFTSKLLRIIALVGSAYIAPFVAPLLKPMALHFISSEFLARNLAMGAAYFLTLLILSIIAHYATKAVKESPLSFFDKALGLFTGFLLSFALIVPVCAMLIALDYDYKKNPTLNNSRVSQWMFKILKNKAPDLKKKGITPYLESAAHFLFSSKEVEEKVSNINLEEELKNITSKIKDIPEGLSPEKLDKGLKTLANTLGGKDKEEKAKKEEHQS